MPAEELNAVLRAIYQPDNYKYEMHRKSLENALQNMLADYEPFEDDEKRSIATLAKNGQLPSREPDTEMETVVDDDDNGHKRNIASMARSGLIGGKRNIQSLARQYASGKRNIGSIMRGSTMYQGSGKRNLASMARNGYGKRNVGTLARDWALPKFSGSKYMDGKNFTSIYPNNLTRLTTPLDGKRNIQALKNSIKNGRKKRETTMGVGEGEALESFFQNGPVDYEELLQSLNEDFPYLMQNQEKRFLGEFSILIRFRDNTEIVVNPRTSQNNNNIDQQQPKTPYRCYGKEWLDSFI